MALRLHDPKKELKKFEKELFNGSFKAVDYEGWEREHLTFHGQVREVKGISPKLAEVPELVTAIKRGTNANELVNPNLLRQEFSERYMWAYIVPKVFSLNKAMWRALLKHREGLYYIHKMPEAAILPYCMGHSIRKVLLKGLRHHADHWSKPAKHFWTAVKHASNFLMLAQQYFTGAQAFQAIELWLAPLAARDRIDYDRAAREFESMFYELNMPYRPGAQCFTKKTMILTKDGWKKWNEVKEGDLVWTFNPKTKKFELQPVLKKVVHPKEVWEKDGLYDVGGYWVTGNHRVVYVENGELRSAFAKELEGKEVELPVVDVEKMEIVGTKKAKVTKVEDYDDFVWDVYVENEYVIVWQEGNKPILTLDSPFTNLTITLFSSKSIEAMSPVVGGKELKDETLGDYRETAKVLLKALFENYKKGAEGTPWTFPIPNILVTNEFIKGIEEDPELYENVWLSAGLMGAPYFENAIVGTKNVIGDDAFLDPEGTYALCCRMISRKDKLSEQMKEAGELTEDVAEELEKENRGTKAHGVFSTAEATGSKGIVTVNLPRLALESKGDLQTMLERLEEELYSLGEMLATWHKWYLWLRWKGMPSVFKFVNEYQGYIEFKRWFFMAFGAVGMPEMANILADEHWSVWQSDDVTAQWRLTKDYIYPVISRMSEIADELGKRSTELFGTYVPFSVEEVPAETASSKLYKKDLAKFGEKALEKYVNPEAEMYSNTVYPYWGRAPILKIAEMEGMVQPKFTGGVMHHFWLGEQLTDPDAVKRLVTAILSKGVVNFSLSPLVCVNGRCWTRIVGWMRPVDNFSEPRKKEFRTRYFKTFDGIRRHDPYKNYEVIEEDPSVDPFANIL